MWGMGRREIKGEIIESQDDMTNRALVHIDKQGKNVNVKIRSRVDGRLLFECNYETDASDRPAYYDAEQIADIYLKANGLYEDKRLSNIELPFVGMSKKRTR